MWTAGGGAAREGKERSVAGNGIRWDGKHYKMKKKKKEEE
jgi:hypothetical protein